MALLFVADIHLSVDRPATVSAFRNFLSTTARNSFGLNVLGDLFDLWIGDDALDDISQSVLIDLQRLTQFGVPVWIMPGNHDFLYGLGFAEFTGCQLLPDPHLIQLGNTRILLMHGDLLCSDDDSYQNFRRMVRNPEWQAQQLRKPVAVRRELARDLQQRTRIVREVKQPSIMQVNANTVESILFTHQAQYLIHGHTHRPGVYQLPKAQIKRIVLPDWCAPGDLAKNENENEAARGGYLEWDDDGKWRLINLWPYPAEVSHIEPQGFS